MGHLSEAVVVVGVWLINTSLLEIVHFGALVQSSEQNLWEGARTATAAAGNAPKPAPDTP